MVQADRRIAAVPWRDRLDGGQTSAWGMSNLDGTLVTRTLRYYEPGVVVPGAIWCAERPGKDPVWSRQLCTALSISRNVKEEVAQVQPVQLTLF